MNRRSFITGMAGILSAGYAPAFVGSSVLMPVRKIWTPKTGMEMMHEWGANLNGYYYSLALSDELKKSVGQMLKFRQFGNIERITY